MESGSVKGPRVLFSGSFGVVLPDVGSDETEAKVYVGRQGWPHYSQTTTSVHNKTDPGDHKM